MTESANRSEKDDMEEIGIVARSHEDYEKEIMNKIEAKLAERQKKETEERAKKKLKTVVSELRILVKRRDVKETELESLYSETGISGGIKRKVESLLQEQEKLGSRILELNLEKTGLLQELKSCGYEEEINDACEPQDKFRSEANSVLEAPVGKGASSSGETETAAETEMQRGVRLGEITGFGSSLQTSSQFDAKAKIGSYMKNLSRGEAGIQSSTSSRKQTGEKRKNKKCRKDSGTKKKLKKIKRDLDESGSEYSGDEEEYEDEEWMTDSDEEEKVLKKLKRAQDDGNKEMYIARLARWEKTRTEEDANMDGQYEKLKEGLKIPALLWSRLFNYQRVAVQWMYELHLQRCGGILGDEMGLGKTIQMIAFLASLSFTRSADSSTSGLGATIIVCPTTVLHQWVSELHKWWPPFRVGVLHTSGSFSGSKSTFIRQMNAWRGIIVLSYQAMVTHQDVLTSLQWEYIILDEGHKIRNPDAKVTLAVKQIATPHRIILSGSPLQNNLKELWSLFDFIYPGKLGTLPTFIQQFSAPITQGGYANASQVQVATAFKCATILRDTINPYLLRRMKEDVKQHINLPEKNEQVLFCKLTDIQRRLYRGYLDSRETKSILEGGMKVFMGLIALRKICNHPDLFAPPVPEDCSGQEDGEEDEEAQRFGWYKRSGKMLVIHSLLKIWKKQGHRVLLFTQSRQMLKVLQNYAVSQGYSYLKLDGTTTVGSRQPLINKFNESKDIFLFILTTKVGGLGVNLTGANRVVIFDPDWNPSTDTQARERAWRIGQEKQVTIYRLMTSGTIEEKIYHRQIYKQFLVNRVLKDPKQRRFFKSNDLYELFTLTETDNDKTETSAIFAGTGTNIKIPVPSFKPKKRNNVEGKDVKSSLNRLYREQENPGELGEEGELVEPQESGVKREPGESNEIVQAMQRESSLNLSEARRLELREKARRISAKFKKSSVTSSKPFSEQSASPSVAVTDLPETIPAPAILPPDASIKNAGLPFSPFTSTLVPDGSITPYTSTPGPSTSYTSSPEPSTQYTSTPGPSTAYTYTPEPSTQYTSTPGPSTSHTLTSEPSNSYTSTPGPSTSFNHTLGSSEKKKKDRKMKKDRGGRFEGERVPHLLKTRRYKPPIQDEEEAEKTAQSQDNYVLARLFAKSGVHSAVQHDAIVDGRLQDYAIIESEANKVADQAISALRASRRECMAAETGVPNWTGQNGMVRKKFSKKIKGTLSSADLLQRMRNRNLISPTIERSEGNSDSIFFPQGREGARGGGGNVNQEDLDLLTDIRNYVAFQAKKDGEASTAELVGKFQKALPSQKSPLFKAFLKQICDFRRENERGIWSLKTEFR